MTLGEIIKNYRVEHGLSQSDFAKLSGLSRGYVSMLEQNKNPKSGKPITLTLDTMQKAAKAIGMDINDLFRLVDEKIKLSPPSLVPFTEPTGDIVSFPVIASVCAGYNGLAVEEYTDETEDIPISMFRGYPVNEIRVFRVSGESMYPRFLDGDKVLVHVQQDVDNGDVAVVIYDGDEATLKRVYHIPSGGIELIPYNPEYPTKRITGPDAKQVYIFGKVLKLIRDV